MKKAKTDRSVVMDGATFIVPNDETPLETHMGALITFKGGRFSAVFEQSLPRAHERKWYQSIGRIRGWIDRIVDDSGGIKKLDPESERLTIAVYNGIGHMRDGTWKFGRLVRSHVSYYARVLYLLDGEERVREDNNYRTELYVCDDVGHVEELNEAQAEMREVIDSYKKLKKRYLTKLPDHRHRTFVVTLAKKQIARLKAKVRRAAGKKRRAA